MPQLARHFVGGGGTGPTRGPGGAVVSPAAASLQASAELPSSVSASAGRASGRPICSAGRSGKQQAATLACAAAPFPLFSYRHLADAPLPHPPPPLPSSPGPASELPRRRGVARWAAGDPERHQGGRPPGSGSLRGQAAGAGPRRRQALRGLPVRRGGGHRGLQGAPAQEPAQPPDRGRRRSPAMLPHVITASEAHAIASTEASLPMPP